VWRRRARQSAKGVGWSVVGGTWESTARERYFTVGLEYARELTHRLAILGVAEHLSEIDAWVFVAPLNYRLGRAHPHPRGHFDLSTGPGLEYLRRGAHGAEGEAHGESEADETFFLWRFGVKYPIHTGVLFKRKQAQQRQDPGAHDQQKAKP